MIITHHGGQCFKVSQGDLTLAFNPPSKDSDLKVSKFGADIALISLNHPDFNGVDTASLGDKKAFVIMGPGEYERSEVEVRGFGSASEYGGKHLNTIYSVQFEGMNLVFLGALSGAVPSDAKQSLDDIDVLFLPIGGEGVLDYSEAEKLAVQLEPKVVIPMHYGGLGQKDALKHFLKEAGAEGVKEMDKLTFKKKDIADKEAEIIVLAQN